MHVSRVKKRKQKYRKLIKSILAVGIVSFLIFGSAAAYYIFKIANMTEVANETLDRGEKSDKREVAVNPKEDNISILFLGVDDRNGDLSGRTDAIVLATFNKGDGTIKMTSIPRDSLVDIPGRKKKDKINHAHAFGGTDLTIETVEHLFDIPIDYFVKVNFTAFMEIVDALGGVEVDVPFTFTEMDSRDRKNAITIREGRQTLNGEEALAYARMRKKDPRGDIGRGERQQEIVKAIIKKGASISSITSYGEVLESLEKHLSMNLTFGNIVSLHSYATKLNSIESLALEGKWDGVSYIILKDESIEAVSNAFKEHLEINSTTKKTP